MYTESRLALSAMRIASFLYLRLSAQICVLLNLRREWPELEGVGKSPQLFFGVKAMETRVLCRKL